MVSHFLCPYAVIRQIDLAQFVQSHQLRRQSKCQILTVLNYFQWFYVVLTLAQGIMNLSINDYGQLNYSFIDIVVVTIPYHWMRLAGGLMFLSGTLLMSYNLYKTYASSKHNLPVLVKIPKVHPGNEI
jgi:cbb3-type cytochrome oxidase subunit 1